MKKFLFFSILSLTFISSVNAKEILFNASAKIIQGEIVNAKKQALKNVMLEAVKKSVENLMDLKIIKTNYGLIRNQIYKYSENFIRHYEIVKEDKIFEKDLYKISILANVNNEKIKKKLKSLRILKEKRKRKKILAVYYNNSKESLPRDNEIVLEIFKKVNESFAEYSFWNFDSQTINEVYSLIKEEAIHGMSVDSLIAIGLIFNADILVIMRMNARQTQNFNDSLYKVLANINFSTYDTYTGQQIAETSITSFENSLKISDNYDLNYLMKKAGKHALEESVRQTVKHIKNYYQNSDFFLHEYSVIFRNYSTIQERIIIDYFENDLSFRNLSELKNTFNHLELELFSKKRKSTLRRKILSDLLEHEIEIASKTIAGNRLIFINPDTIEEIKESDNVSKFNKNYN